MQAEQAHARDPAGHRDERRRRPRKEALNRNQNPHHDGAHRHGCQRGMWNALGDGQKVVNERALVKMKAQQLGDLIEHDDEPDPGFEADQHRFGDEVGYEAEAQECRQDEHDAYEQCQRRAGGRERRRISAWSCLTEGRCRQNGKRRRRAHAEWPGTSQRSVNPHGKKRGVEPNLHGKSGDRGVGHGFGDHDCGGG